MRTAAIYTRVSTSAQDGNDKASPDLQKQKCLAKAEEQGFEVPAELIFHEAQSGADDINKRKALASMLEAAKAGKFSRLYFYDADRLARNEKVYHTIKEVLEGAGVERVGVMVDVANPLADSLYAAVAADERSKIRKRTMEGKRDKMSKGYWPQPIPYGYKRGPDMTLEKDPQEAKVLNDIFRWSCEGLGRINIARRLTERNVPPPSFAWLDKTQKPRGKRYPFKECRVRSNEVGGWPGYREILKQDNFIEIAHPQWDIDSITVLLQNTMMKGVRGTGPFKGLKPIIHGGPAVDPDLWKKANEASKGRYMKGKREKAIRLLTGKINCGSCGRSYVYHQGSGGYLKDDKGEVLKGKNGKPLREPFHYYICSNKRSGNGCKAKNIYMIKADQMALEAVNEYLSERLSKADILAELTASFEADLADLKARRSETQSLLDALRVKHDQVAAKLLDFDSKVSKRVMDMLLTKDNELASQINKQQAELNDLDSRIAVQEQNAIQDANDLEETLFFADLILPLTWVYEPFPVNAPNDAPDPTREIVQTLIKSGVVVPPAGIADPKNKDMEYHCELDTSDKALKRVIDLLIEYGTKTMQLAKAEDSQRKVSPIDKELEAKLKAYVASQKFDEKS